MKLYVQVKPRSSRDRVEQLDETHFRVRVRAVPDRGLANEAVRELLAAHLGISKTLLSLVSGGASRNKIFRLDVPD